MAEGNDRAVEAWSLLIDTYSALMPRFEAELRQEVGIPISWFDVTANLVTEPDYQLRMGELADRTVISFSRVSRVVGELASQGLVERITDPDDRRGVIVKLTVAGRKLQRAAGRVHMRGVREHFAAHLNTEQANALVTAFDIVLAAQGKRPSPLTAWPGPSHPTP